MKISILLYLPLLLCNTLFAQNNHFVTISTIKCRSLGMGGATTSIQDDLGVIDINPAAFNLYRVKKPHRFTFFLIQYPLLLRPLEIMKLQRESIQILLMPVLH